MIWYRSVTWWVGLAMIVLTAIIMIESAEWSLGGKLFPWMVGTGVLITAGLHTALSITRGVTVAEESKDQQTSQPFDLKRAWQVSLWILAVLIAVPLIGLQIAVPIFIFLFMKLHEESWLLSLASAAVIAAFIVFVLEGALHIVFPQALLVQWMGI